MVIVAELLGRAIAHPATTAFVKRAVPGPDGDGDDIKMPTWGFVVLYLSTMFSGIVIVMVSEPLEPCDQQRTHH